MFVELYLQQTCEWNMRELFLRIQPTVKYEINGLKYDTKLLSLKVYQANQNILSELGTYNFSRIVLSQQ